jgi:hypothetical protein
LVYSILKDQQSTKKNAILNAFQANMNGRAYTATFAGQPVDRAAVESYYNDLMNAYPEGSIERDNLRAELIDFHNKAINAEINAYAEAYKEGGNAFGTKIELTQYLGFLRDARANTTSEDDKNKYNLEEFLVTFNDVHDDMKAKGSNAGALAAFYKRELARAEDMGITKDSDSYRTIQQYLATAAKTSLAEGRQQAAQNAADAVSARMTTAGTSIAASLAAAVASGRITAQDRVAIIGDGTGNGIVSRFANLDLSTKQRIFAEGEKAGVQMNGETFTAEVFVDYVGQTRSILQTLIASGNVDAASKSVYRGLLGSFDAEVSGPVGLMTDLAKADNSALDLIIDNEHGLGNPVVNVEAYKNHSANISGSGASAIAGQAMLDIMNGKVPDPSNFGGKTELWQLTPVEQSRLVESYTGNAYIATGGLQDPKEFISTVIADYTDAHNVATGASFVTSVIDESGNAAVQITDQPATGGTPFIYSTKLSDGRVVPVVGRQQTQAVLGTDGSQLGKVIFDVDANGQVKKSFVTMDGYKMDYDTFERWIDTKGIRSAVDGNGQIQVNVDGTDPQMTQYFNSSTIRQDPAYGSSVDKNAWNGVAEGQNADAARRIIGKSIADQMVTGTPGSITLDVASGKLIVADPEAALRDYGINAQDLETVMNANTPGSDYNGIKTAIGDALFRKSERTDQFNPAPLKDGQKDPTLIGVETAASLEAKRRREENAARMTTTNADGTKSIDFISSIAALLGIGAGKGPRELQLEQMRAEAARKEAERRAAEVEAQQIRPTIDNPSGATPTPYSTVNKDPVASYFLRHTEFVNPALGNAAPATFATTKLGSAPALTTTTMSPSLIDFRVGERSATTSANRIVPNGKRRSV